MYLGDTVITGQEARASVKLTDFADNHYSQFGEDGIIHHIFDRIGTTGGSCLEVGAGDGIDCSNVTSLWRHLGWQAILIEADLDTYTKLKANAGSWSNCHLFHQEVTAWGEGCLDDIINPTRLAIPPELDFLSLDIDGNEIHVLRHLRAQPRVLCIEFNPTVPPDVSLYQEYTSEPMGFGSSLRSLQEMASKKGYTFVGATYCNGFFVRSDLAGPFKDYDPTLDFSPTYLVSDFKGNALAVGNKLPWGIRTPYTGPNLVGETIPMESNGPLNSYEERYGDAIHWVQPGWPNIADPDENIPPERGHNARALLTFLMESNLSPICVDTMHVSSPAHLDWIHSVAEEHHYQFRIGGNMVALVRQ